MVSIVVPVYNEEDLIVQFHEAVSSALQGSIDELGSCVCQRWFDRFDPRTLEEPAGARSPCRSGGAFSQLGPGGSDLRRPPHRKLGGP